MDRVVLREYLRRRIIKTKGKIIVALHVYIIRSLDINGNSSLLNMLVN